MVFQSDYFEDTRQRQEMGAIAHLTVAPADAGAGATCQAKYLFLVADDVTSEPHQQNRAPSVLQYIPIYALSPPYSLSWPRLLILEYDGTRFLS